jgi:hypothetical protein
MAHRNTTVAGTLTVGGVEYVVIPKAEYLRMRATTLPPGTVDTRAYVRGSIAAALKQARDAAGLTQAELAERMGKESDHDQPGRVWRRACKRTLRGVRAQSMWVAPRLAH